MFDLMLVHEALSRSRPLEMSAEDQDSLISQLVHDTFGGEILKTHRNRGWHFYNRIDGLRLDFTRLEASIKSNRKKYEDIPAIPDENHVNFEKEQYLPFLMNFIIAFEEIVGLKNYQTDYSN